MPEERKYNNPDDREMFEEYLTFFQHTKMMYDASVKAGFTKKESMEIVKTLINATFPGGKSNG